MQVLNYKKKLLNFEQDLSDLRLILPKNEKINNDNKNSYSILDQVSILKILLYRFTFYLNNS